MWLLLLLKLGSVETSVQLRAVYWTPHLQLGGFGGLRLERGAPKERTGGFLEQQQLRAASSRSTFAVKHDKETSGRQIRNVGGTGCRINTDTQKISL